MLHSENFRGEQAKVSEWRLCNCPELYECKLAATCLGDVVQIYSCTRRVLVTSFKD